MNKEQQNEQQNGRMIEASQPKQQDARIDLNSILCKAYVDKYGKNPSTAANRAIACIDETFLADWAKDRMAWAEEMAEQNESLTLSLSCTKSNADAALAQFNCRVIEANKKLEQIKEETDGLREITGHIHDPRVADALLAYQAIVAMNFRDDEMQLQNIKNASYFVWALFASPESRGNVSNTFFQGSDTTEKKTEKLDAGKSGSRKSGMLRV